MELFSSFQHLNQMLSVELFQASLGDTHQSSFAELSKKLTKEKERHKLVAQILKYYISERRHLLRCVKHLFGYWQDSSHPYRVRRDELSPQALTLPPSVLISDVMLIFRRRMRNVFTFWKLDSIST